MIAGLVLGAIVLTGLGGPAVAMAVRGGAATRRRRAEKFADGTDLPLPAELVDLVHARLRRQSLAAASVSILILVPLAYFYGYSAWNSIRTSAEFSPVLQATQILIPLGVVGTAQAVGHAVDVARTHRAPGPRFARLDPVQLAEVISRPVTFLTRVTALLPAAVTVLVIALARLIPIQPPSPAWVTTSIALSVFAILVAGIVEHVQRRVLQGRQVAGTVQELAFDDAFRAQAARFLSFPPPAVAYIAAAIIVSPVVTLPGHFGPAHIAVKTVWSLVSVGMIVLWYRTLLATTRRSRRTG